MVSSRLFINYLKAYLTANPTFTPNSRSGTTRTVGPKSNARFIGMNCVVYSIPTTPVDPPQKPVCVDPAGARSIIASSKKAEALGLVVGTGTQRRHQRNEIQPDFRGYNQPVKEIHDSQHINT